MNQTAAPRINLESSKVKKFEFLDDLNIPNLKKKHCRYQSTYSI